MPEPAIGGKGTERSVPVVFDDACEVTRCSEGGQCSGNTGSCLGGCLGFPWRRRVQRNMGAPSNQVNQQQPWAIARVAGRKAAVMMVFTRAWAQG